MNNKLDITNAIGNTPLIRLKNIVPQGCADIYLKLEYFNPTGSYKDRMAFAIIEGAVRKKLLAPGTTVLECTAGGTGTSLAFVCAVKGYPFKVVSSDAFAEEKLMAMRLFGAELELLASNGKGITPDLIPKMISRVEALANEDGYYWTRQFENKDAIDGYRTMGKEILNQIDKPINVFCAAVGTAGMLMGVAYELKKANAGTRVVVLEPESAPLLSQGIKGKHKIDGIAVGFVPPLLDKTMYDEVRTVDEVAARTMAKRLAKEEGVFAGTSTGLNVVAAIKLGKQLGPGNIIVTVACDSGLKYLTTGLFDVDS